VVERKLTVGRAFATGGVALLALVVAGCGADDGQPERATGPVAALYVIDHRGEDPPDGALAPYAEAFRRVRAGCLIGPGALADRVIHIADSATVGSGRDVSILEALRAVARLAGPTRVDCTDLFARAEAFLGGGAMP
jgi:hypothetical protein